MRPMVLAPNPVPRFYAGGQRIARLRGLPASATPAPEDWVASTTQTFEAPGTGLSALPDGRLLRDAVRADPEGWLGADHVARWGADPALLVKLLDAGERLPVHLHPSGPVARAQLGAPFGKTEAWVVLAGSGPVWMGWREDVDAEQLRRWVAGQEVEAMLDALHRLELGPGDALHVPAGVAHAIGAGLLIAELQEPSDMSVLLEWRPPGVEDEAGATVGLGWTSALAAVERGARDPHGLLVRADPAPSAALPPASAPFFRADWLAPAATLEPSFAVLVARDAGGHLHTHGGDALTYAQGDTVVIPHGAGPVEIAGAGALLRCRPPAPEAPEGPGR